VRRATTLALLLFFAASLQAAERQRVASLLPWITDAFVRIPQRVEVVASVSDASFRVPQGVRDLGNPHSPNFELLAAARPTIVVGDRRLHGVLREKLARSGAQIVFVEGSSLASTFDGLVQAGDAAGAGAEMRSLVANARREIASLRLAQPMNVLPLFGTPSAFMAVTGNTWLGDLLRELRFRNLAETATGNQPFPGYVELSDETLSTLRPQRVLLIAHGAPDAVEASFRRKTQENGAWRALGTNVSILPADRFSRNPGLRMADAARFLVEHYGRNGT
jgi:iron complex transport system substrate-binding protein